MREKEGFGSEAGIGYVIYLIDGIGEEYFINQQDTLVPVKSSGDQQPLEVKSFVQISVQLAMFRKMYPSNCRLFALERSEFDQQLSQQKDSRAT